MPRVVVFGKLPDDWFTNASEAVKWKGRFACCNSLYDVVETLTEKSTVKGGKLADKAIAHLADWLDTEQHVFTRIKILLILIKLIPAMSIDSFTKKHRKIATGCMKQYSEKKVCNLVNPVLVSLWVKEGSFSNWSESILNTLKSPNPIPKAFLYSFITDSAIANPAKAKEEIKKLLKDHGTDLMAILVKDTDSRNPDCKKGATRFLCIIGIFMAKEKDKRYIKIINSLCEQNAKVKTNIDLMKPEIRSSMKQNAIRLRKENIGEDNNNKKPPKSRKEMPMTVDDEKMQINLKQSISSDASMNGVSSIEVVRLKNEITQLSGTMNLMKIDMSSMMKYIDEQKQNIHNRRMVLGIGASVHDLFENFLVGVIGMPQYLERFKAAGANDIRMVEHFDVPFSYSLVFCVQ